MIAFGAAISEPEPYARYAEAGIRLSAEPDSEVYAFAGVGSICRTYNLMLDTAAARDDLEALVIVHPHTEIVDPELCAKARQGLADERVGVIGAAGARGVQSIAWWEGEVTAAPIVHRYHEYGSGEFDAYAWTRPAAPPAEVESVDPFLFVLSPWMVRNIRFDESLHVGHGYELDLCLQARAAGRKVMVHDLRVIQHRSLEPFDDIDLWIGSHVRLATKWDERLPDVDGDADEWKALARRAEAEAEAARAITYSHMLAADARVLALERALETMTESTAWRLTLPLRRLNHLRESRTKRASGART